MKNKEKYEDNLLNILINREETSMCDFRMQYMLLTKDCLNLQCNECDKRFANWLNKEYEEVVDWSIVPINTPIYVYDNENSKLEYRRHYAGLSEDGEIYAWSDGLTSWTTDEKVCWRHGGRLAGVEVIEPKWIPTEVRLPNRAEQTHSTVISYYLSEFIVMIKGATIPTTLYFKKDTRKWVDTDYNEYDVVAWMPLPNAYIEEKENEIV